MKTFSEFIAEAEVKWNTGRIRDGKSSPASVARQKLNALTSKLTQNLSDKNLAQRVKILRAKIKHEDERAKERDPRPENKDTGRQNTKIRGYASKPRDVVSRVGTTSDVQRSDLPAERDVITQHRYAKSGTAGGRGTNISRSGRTYGTRGS